MTAQAGPAGGGSATIVETRQTRFDVVLRREITPQTILEGLRQDDRISDEFYHELLANCDDPNVLFYIQKHLLTEEEEKEREYLRGLIPNFETMDQLDREYSALLRFEAAQQSILAGAREEAAADEAETNALLHRLHQMGLNRAGRDKKVSDLATRQVTLAEKLKGIFS